MNKFHLFVRNNYYDSSLVVDNNFGEGVSYGPNDTIALIRELCQGLLSEEGTNNPGIHCTSKANAPGFRFGSLPDNPVYNNDGTLANVGENISSTQLLTLDIDGFSPDVNVTMVDDLLVSWIGKSTKFIWWTTPSSTWQGPRVRMVALLSEEISKQNLKQLGYRLEIPEKLVIDEQSFNLSQFFILPCKIGTDPFFCKEDFEEGTVDFVYKFHDGNPLDIKKLKQKPIENRIAPICRNIKQAYKSVQIDIEALAEEINNIPSGEGYTKIKALVAKYFNGIPTESVDGLADLIDDPERRKKFLGMYHWVEQQEFSKHH